MNFSHFISEVLTMHATVELFHVVCSLRLMITQCPQVPPSLHAYASVVIARHSMQLTPSTVMMEVLSGWSLNDRFVYSYCNSMQNFLMVCLDKL